MAKNKHYCKSRQAQGPSLQKDGSNLRSFSAPVPAAAWLPSGLRYRQASVARRHHLIGTQPSREWEIVSLKIGCPLFWLSPPSVPPQRHRAAGPGKNIQKNSSLSGGSRVVFLEVRSGMGCYQGDAEHRTRGPCLISCFWERAISTTFSTGAATRAHPAPLEVRGHSGATQPIPALRDAVPSRPTAKAKQLSLALVAAPAAAPPLFPTRKLSLAIPLSCGGLCFNSLCNFWFKEPEFTGSKASQESF